VTLTDIDRFLNQLGDEARAIAMQDFRTEIVRVTRFSTDCYGYAMLASGHFDLVIEDGLKIHDVMAIVPVILGAGGILTTWSGGTIDEAFEGDIIAAATQTLHDEASR
jgi:fructose-1,6-bisphosphatase/inositol monophosphatase family enzyme